MLDQSDALDLCKRDIDDNGSNEDNHSNSVTLGSSRSHEVQEASCGVKVTRKISAETFNLCNGFNRSLAEDDEQEKLSITETENNDLEELGNNQPEDLSTKVKVNHLDNSRSSSPHVQHNIQCQHCDFTGDTKETFDQHLLQHSKQSALQCQKCHSKFQTSAHLHHHMFMVHNSLQTNDSNIAQQNNAGHKRHFDEIRASSDDSMSEKSNSPSHYTVTPSAQYDPVFLHSLDMASKHPRLDNSSLGLLSSTSAIPPHLALLDMSMGNHSRAFQRSPLQVDSDASDTHVTADQSSKQHSTELLEVHVCQVCSKPFPKPSDLKRHMMCHTGEKPFRCEFCSKPFRAKSSMHYHLKATHGMDIELSPGLEERYLRMKTRAQMNLLQKGHLMGLSVQYGSEKDASRSSRENHDYDDLEEDQNLESYYQHSGNGTDVVSDPKSQGYNCLTGNDSKSVLDLSVSGHGRWNGKDSQANVHEDIVLYDKTPSKHSKLSVQNETVLVTRLDGIDLIHGENKSLFKCHLCLKTHLSLSELKRHLSVHDNNMALEYVCWFCDAKFCSKSQIKDHMRRQHLSDVAHLCSEDNGKFSCKFCVKKFDSKDALLKHGQLHIIIRSYCCQICGKMFSQYTSLQVHISRFHRTVLSMKNSSWVRRKLSFLHVKRFRPKSADLILKTDKNEPLNLVSKRDNQNTEEISNQNVTVVMPQSPPATEDSTSDFAAETGHSQHSSDNNWPETASDNPGLDPNESDNEIRSAPQRILPPHRKELSPKGRCYRKSSPGMSAFHSYPSSDNDEPLNFSKSVRSPQDTNNNESSNGVNNRLTPELHLPITATNPEAILPGYALNATNHFLMVKALAAHQSLTQHLNNTSQPMIFPPNHLPPSLAAMSQMMSLPGTSGRLQEPKAGTSKSPSPASHSSSKSDTSPEDRDSKVGIRESLSGYSRLGWGQDKSLPMWSFNIYSPPDTGHTDGRKVTSLSRTHSRLGIVQSPINRESMCKATTLTDGRTVYKCPFCSKEFVSFSDINRHMDFHEDIRPYKCHYCDYYARTNSQLKVHMMRHQGIREFCCKLCNYKGVTQSDLNRHMKSQIHTLKSRNACSYCGEGFVTTKNLEKHLDGNCIIKMQKLNGELDLPPQTEYE